MQRPFWLAEALAIHPGEACPPLQGESHTDLCIVGGGFTGLWTAILTKQARPDLRIVIIEQDICGGGASGRNGGCLLTWSTKYPSLADHVGAAEARRLISASEQAVFDIAQFCARHQIDAELRLGGAIYAASNPAQTGRLDEVMASLSRLDLSHWQALDDARCHQLTGSTRLHQGWYSAAAGSVQPAKLVRGLRRVALAMGIRIHEHTPLRRLHRGDPIRLEIGQGQITARQVVLAVNAHLPNLVPGLARSMVLVSSDMIITEPVPDLITKLGLQHGQSVCDLRTFVHYWRSTADGRLMLGKGGNRIAFGNRYLAAFDQPSQYQHPLRQRLHHFFPELAHTTVAASWTGASDRSVSGFPFFGHLPDQPNVLYGAGYSGNGVVQSYLGGTLLSARLLGLDNAWTRSPLFGGPIRQYPPEPIRWAGAMLIRQAIRRKERAEDRQHPVAWLDERLSRLAASAGKSG
ncbi:putative aminophosphonate oxidoreductase [Chitinivorax tropicus]|uniref:Putative aminophosphonate oxidoreductase n=1 Tax=Chitinivorax tropicus TaxID=714531 RepID=A0A840MNC3_9PROT|nr:FAD-dependent oxidoreductase [Chitinivorax tropicus]MBB5018599.1 putative aminophosphonate oxidoreductase [Chitinivorax tropicus]